MQTHHDIKMTFLSQRPHKKSKWAALFSFAFILFWSVLAWENFAGVSRYLVATPQNVFEYGQYWRIFTTMFVHSDFEHFLANSMPIIVWSYLLWGYFGYLMYPTAILLLGMFVTYVSLGTYPAQVGLVGASGLVYLMSGIWLVLYFLIDRRYSVPNRLLRTTGFSLLLLIPTSYSPGVSYRTHGIGFFVGRCLWTYILFVQKAIS